MARSARHIHHIFLSVALIAASGYTSAATPVLDAVRSAAQSVSEVFPVVPARAGLSPRLAALSSVLIVRWEVGSPSRYTQRYAGVYWPGGASGPTWGIGYDGGHQTASAILRDWSEHPLSNRLAQTSGLTGQAAKLAVGRWRGITTPFILANSVFQNRTLPAYALQTERTLGTHYTTLPEPTQAALISLGYNRGWSMLGQRNVEKRAIKNDCLPRQDTACIAIQLRSMCRLWAGTPNGAGLCSRRNDEARVAVQI